MSKIKYLKYYKIGKRLLTDEVYLDSQRKGELEVSKSPSRTEIINFLISTLNRETCYLEIGVRNPEDNFNHITATKKYSVDPGVEFEENPVDFKMTSDEFFVRVRQDEVLHSAIKFDVIFIDGLHLAEQVNRDILNALDFIAEDGFVVLHDCNPPTEWYSREAYGFKLSPARGIWSGTTWKAFLKWRSNPSVKSCCIDSDWGVGILSKTQPIGTEIENTNPFFEHYILDQNRKNLLNLINFEELKRILN